MITKINKKGEIGTTLTGIVATFIVVFIMIIYLFFSSLMAGKNLIPGSGSSFSVEGSDNINIEEELLLEEFISILNSPTESKTENYQDVSDLILYSLDPFIENEELMKELDYDINNLRFFYSGLDVNQNKERITRTDLLIEELQKVLLKRCDIYNLEIPQGFVFPKDYQLGNLDSDFSWTEWASVKIPYKDNIIEIKYRRSTKC